ATTSGSRLASAGTPASGMTAAQELVLLEERRQIVTQQITDLGKLEVGGGILGQSIRIGCIMALPDEYGGHPLAPEFLHRGEDAQLVVDENVVVGRVEPLYVLKLAFLVNVDEHAIMHRPPQPGALHLAR